ncbi:MAG: ABC transporter permease [Ilumatobacteraceae bacterium]|jgi:peptide/nickel transport system permease protein|nr:ABC transporter permease [Ilumatobacteraceae bacterium]
MEHTDLDNRLPEFPRDRLSNVSTSVTTGVDVAPKKATFQEVVSSMPLRVKFASLWIVVVVVGAIYAKIDTSWLGGSLPLQDPNFQTNGFDRATGSFGTGEPIEGMSAAHWLGTDAIARDTFARLVHGGWVSLVVVVVSAACGVIIGGFLGSLVGFVRGRTETVIMATVDVILAFPALVLLLALVSIFEVRNLFVISTVIGVLSIPAYTRVARANALAISSREFVTAARAIGTKPSRILFREVIPNVLPTLLAYAMVAAAFVVVVEGSLSFLGLSVQLPTPTWGNMINQARRDIKLNVAQVIWPSLALSITVLSLNQVGDFFQQRRAVKGSNL